MTSAPRIIAIGDIHGCIQALDSLIRLICPLPQDTVISLGDFIDDGPGTRQVIDLLIALSARCRVVTIKGNHEEMLLDSLTDESTRAHWLNVGGIATLNSYFFGASLPFLPEAHLKFIRNTRDYYETEHHIFTHANYDPQLPMNEQPAFELRWALLEPPYPAPHFSGKTVVVGHTEQRSGDVLNLGHIIDLDTACVRYGWLSALDVTTGELWQVNRWGVPRDKALEVRDL